MPTTWPFGNRAAKRLGLASEWSRSYSAGISVAASGYALMALHNAVFSAWVSSGPPTALPTGLVGSGELPA